MTASQFFTTIVLFLGASYTFLTFHPAVLFSTKTEGGNATIYSQAPLHEFAGATLDRVSAKLALSDFTAPALKYEIFITGDSPVYTLLAPFCRKEYSCVHPLTGHIFVYSADFQNDKAFSPGGYEEPRLLESVLTHEMVKAQIRAKEGGLKYYLLSAAKTDGYAGHVTMETGALQPAEICKPDPKRATLVRFLENRLTIELLKFESDSTYLSLVRDSSDDKTANKKLRGNTCK